MKLPGFPQKTAVHQLTTESSPLSKQGERKVAQARESVAGNSDLVPSIKILLKMSFALPQQTRKFAFKLVTQFL